MQPIMPSDQDGSGRSFDEDELRLLADVLASGTLTATKGSMTKRLEAEFGALLGSEHVIACSSGSAAVHAAVAALDLEPGDEIITTAITDMGAITGLLYQGVIPVFADVDPVSLNVTLDTVAARLSDRTRAVIVTHLLGNPADITRIAAWCRQRGLWVIEDAAQAYGATVQGRPVGTLGDIGCFSTQQGKHLTAGEGGFVVTDDDALARRTRLFVNKGWPYGESGPDHEFLAPNYRTTELQSAVLLGQLPKLAGGVRRRIENAESLARDLVGVPGVYLPQVRTGDRCSYWRVAADRPGGGTGRSCRRRGLPGAVRRGLRTPIRPQACLRVQGDRRPGHVRDQRMALLDRPSRGARLRPRSLPGRTRAATCVVLPLEREAHRAARRGSRPPSATRPEGRHDRSGRPRRTPAHRNGRRRSYRPGVRRSALDSIRARRRRRPRRVDVLRRRGRSTSGVRTFAPWTISLT
ncbi:MAG: aminotransferase class V-fold PLP-dependent enzyme [Ilumatobacteraceae bacterium]